MNDPRGDAAWTDPTEPPHWGTGRAKLDGTALVWVAWLPDDTTHPHLWHWCSRAGHRAKSGASVEDWPPRWAIAGVQAHDVLQREPLTLSPSVYWPDCCGLHGFVREGRWVGA